MKYSAPVTWYINFNDRDSYQTHVIGPDNCQTIAKPSMTGTTSLHPKCVGVGEGRRPLTSIKEKNNFKKGKGF